ncbi:hypothetical protein CLAVI_000422 [Candidatus Clavichlamydia salmonicola]|uniref:hypothetical protein n=1 Tax=Candidatus Clavichlamydia salmonicola TaxID=469812 RepID=UPI001891B2C7|nr:hypothetical protein [Candidatus Clavichlamydia salmonicola]MBF5050803.1 hypothetical protein [Candidatus Clavichlamydia salmonicola]
MSLSGPLYSTSLMTTMGNVPTRNAVLVPKEVLASIKNNVSNKEIVNISSYYKKTKKLHQIANFISTLNLVCATILAIAVSVFAGLGRFLPIATASMLGCLAVSMITRLIMAVYNLRQLYTCEKELTQINISIFDKRNEEKTIDKKELQFVSNAAKSTRDIVISQIHLQKTSIAAAALTLIAVTGLAVAVGLILANICAGSCIGSTSVISSFSATHLLLMSSGSLLGIGLLMHLGLGIKSIHRRCQLKDTANQLRFTLRTLANDLKN